jgi:hypothetical protein
METLQHETVLDNVNQPGILSESDVMLGAAMRVAEQFGFDPAAANQDLQNLLMAEPTAEAPLIPARCATIDQAGRVHAYGDI